MFRYFCFLALFWNVKSATAPFITPCKNGDTACVQASATALMPLLARGIPEFGMKPLDPLKVPRITSEQGSLKITMTDTELTGLKDCKIETLKHDRIKGKQVLVLRCDMSLEGDYVLDGQLLILPVQGKGRYKIDIRDIVIKILTDLTSEQGPDGKEHWKVVKWRESFQVKTGVKFHFDNLFNGNKALADPVLEFANTSWKDVMQEIAPPIIHTIIAAVFEEFKALYKAVPAEELYIP
ncbi:PREDICTED: protein takeout-like [Papilio polytes]|uniref:protein takeout-like n=1 Tax=Papilio polytes TaxID=76194 RepID=UPI0006763FF8|nr:PREDICTED: protein takeout-like [Papilio polytes]